LTEEDAARWKTRVCGARVTVTRMKNAKTVWCVGITTASSLDSSTMRRMIAV